MNKTDKFAESLKELMLEKGISQSELQRQTGITSQAISLWLKGQREPLLSYIWTLADYFDCSIDYLVGRTDE